MKMHTGGWVRSEKLSHKIAIKHEKGDPSRFSDKPKYPLEKNLAGAPSRPPPPPTDFPTTMMYT